jgi:hypothetical protein
MHDKRQGNEELLAVYATQLVTWQSSWSEHHLAHLHHSQHAPNCVCHKLGAGGLPVMLFTCHLNHSATLLQSNIQ